MLICICDLLEGNNNSFNIGGGIQKLVPNFCWLLYWEYLIRILLIEFHNIPNQRKRKMKGPFMILILVTVVVSQSAPSCQICRQVANCPSYLMSDSAIDPIYNSLIQKISYSSPPLSIYRDQSSSEANYTFSWSNQMYLANLDLATLSYKIVAQQIAQNLQRIQDNVNNVYSLPLNLNLATNLSKIIDSDIQRQYFNGAKATCISFQNVTGGFHIIYQKDDGSTVAFDVRVQNRGGNSYSLSYSICTQDQNYKSTQFVSVQNGPKFIPSSSQAYPSKPLITTSPNSNPLPLLFKTPQSTLVGGYSSVINPLNDTDVQSILQLLVKQHGNVIKSGILGSVSRQVVSGLNYKLAISFDQSSPMYYQIIIYKTLQGQYSVSSQKMVDVPTSYNFSSTYLNTAQAAKLSYFSSLINLVTQQPASIVTKDSVVDQYYQNLPYIKMVLHNAVYSQIQIIVQYDILQNTIQVLNQSSILSQQQIQKSPSQQPPTNLRVQDDKDNSLTYIANCLSQTANVCTKCVPQYYISAGLCKQMPKDCSSFNYSSNLCEICNKGYYLDDNKVCQLSQFLCQSSSSRGYCLSCLQNYSLSFDGKCIYNAEGADYKYPQQEANPLCSKFNGPSCLSCVSSCYLNKKGSCKVVDPNCSTFDSNNEICKVCKNSYIVSKASNLCVPASCSQ